MASVLCSATIQAVYRDNKQVQETGQQYIRTTTFLWNKDTTNPHFNMYCKVRWGEHNINFEDNNISTREGKFQFLIDPIWELILNDVEHTYTALHAMCVGHYGDHLNFTDIKLINYTRYENS